MSDVRLRNDGAQRVRGVQMQRAAANEVASSMLQVHISMAAKGGPKVGRVGTEGS